MLNGILRKGTSATLGFGPFVDNADFKTVKTGVAVSADQCFLYKNGGAETAKSAGNGTHLGHGIFAVSVDPTDTNTAGILMVYVSALSCLPWSAKYQVLVCATYDALFGATPTGFDDNGKVTVVSIAANAINASAIATDAITAAKIADSAITVSKVADNTITAAKIASDAITAAKIATDAITSTKVADGAFDNTVFATSVYDQIWATTVEDAYTAVQFMRGFAAVLMGTASGMATTTNIFKSMDAGINRVSATTDSDGNRTAIALSLAP